MVNPPPTTHVPMPVGEPWTWDPLGAVVYDTALTAIDHTVAAATALLDTAQDPDRVADLTWIRDEAVQARRDLRADAPATAADTAARYADVSRILARDLPGGGETP